MNKKLKRHKFSRCAYARNRYGPRSVYTMCDCDDSLYSECICTSLVQMIACPWFKHSKLAFMLEVTDKDLKDITELKQIHCKDSLQAKIRSAQKKAKSSMLRAQKEKCKRLNEGK